MRHPLNIGENIKFSEIDRKLSQILDVLAAVHYERSKFCQNLTEYNFLLLTAWGMCDKYSRRYGYPHNLEKTLTVLTENLPNF